MIFAVPSKDTPPIVRAFCNAVAVAAFPVQDPDEPDVFPVTLPVRAPTNVVAVTTPATLTLSRFVCQSTSKSLATDTLPLDAILNLVAVLVTS